MQTVVVRAVRREHYAVRVRGSVAVPSKPLCSESPGQVIVRRWFGKFGALAPYRQQIVPRARSPSRSTA